MGNTKLIQDLNLRLVRVETERDNLLQELERLARENGRLQAAIKDAILARNMDGGPDV